MKCNNKGAFQMDDYLKLVIRLQAIVQNVLVYANNEFDKERYEKIGDPSLTVFYL